MSGKFPKRIPELTKEQLAIKEDFYSFLATKIKKKLWYS